MSAATDEQRAALRNACRDIASGGARAVRDSIGRAVKVVTIIADTSDLNIYTGVCGMGREELHALLRSLLDASETNNYSLRVEAPGGEVVFERGKPS